MRSITETMGLHYIAWRPVSERPPPHKCPQRTYLGWLHGGRVEHGISTIVRYLDGFGQHACAETEGALDQARLAKDVGKRCGVDLLPRAQAL